MKRTLIIIFVLLIIGKAGHSQNAHFSTNGFIEYEKTVNMFALLKKEMNKDNEDWLRPFYDAYVKNNPQFRKLKSSLTFSSDKTLFTPIEDENAPPNNFWGNIMADQYNTIYTDVAQSNVVCQKKVYEETFLVKDSTRKINWKITSETREIAGYKCRRANALVLDSIYVVAFYTDEIPVSGGPESFNGLPGMILGVALPHENITWFATKVTDILATPKPIAPPTKGKPTDNKGLSKTLHAALKDWGKYAQTDLKAFSL